MAMNIKLTQLISTAKSCIENRKTAKIADGINDYARGYMLGAKSKSAAKVVLTQQYFLNWPKSMFKSFANSPFVQGIKDAASKIK